MERCKRCNVLFAAKNERHQFCSKRCIDLHQKQQQVDRNRLGSRDLSKRTPTSTSLHETHPFEAHFDKTKRREIRHHFTKWIYKKVSIADAIIGLVASNINDNDPLTPTETYLIHLIYSKKDQCINYIEHLTQEIQQWDNLKSR